MMKTMFGFFLAKMLPEPIKQNVKHASTVKLLDINLFMIIFYPIMG